MGESAMAALWLLDAAERADSECCGKLRSNEEEGAGWRAELVGVEAAEVSVTLHTDQQKHSAEMSLDARLRSLRDDSSIELLLLVASGAAALFFAAAVVALSVLCCLCGLTLVC